MDIVPSFTKYTPPTEGIRISWGMWVGGSLRPKDLKKCIKLNWDYQRGRWGGGVGLGKYFFCRDIFWNYTFSYGALVSVLTRFDLH